MQILFANIIFLYFCHSIAWLFYLIRYRVLCQMCHSHSLPSPNPIFAAQILVFLYKTPCDLLTPVWMVLAIYAPYYVYTVAFPAFHFCVMIERVRATLFAAKYEHEDRRLGI